ncbi:MAG: RNA polymerase sigma factor, partial [Candidatus Promineifilaceae bacterium]
MSENEQRQIFDQWLHMHKGIFFKIVRAYAFTPNDQDDLFQEITLQVWQSIPNFRGEAKASTWIYRVALYAASSWVRQEKKRPLTRSLFDVEHTLTLTDQPQ